MNHKLNKISSAKTIAVVLLIVVWSVMVSVKSSSNVDDTERRVYEQLVKYKGTTAEKTARWEQFRKSLKHGSPYLYTTLKMIHILEKEARWHKFIAAEKQAEALRVKNADHNDYIKQPGAGLKWLRCPVGQTWGGKFCEGTPKGFTWQQAKKACPKGYRLPSIKEYGRLFAKIDPGKLKYLLRTGETSITQRFVRCSLQKECASMFGSDGGHYWSSSSPKRCRDSSCKKSIYVSLFSEGYYSAFIAHSKKRFFGVRCVR